MKWILSHKGAIGFWAAISLTAIVGTITVALNIALLLSGAHCERYTPTTMIAGKAIIIQRVCAEWSEQP